MEDQSLHTKLDALLELEKQNARNIYTLYRRITALAHMVEAAAEGKEPRLPRTLRAEIDASLDAERFAQLADQDQAEFLRRYGEEVLNVLRQHGVAAITKIGEFAPSKYEKVTH